VVAVEIVTWATAGSAKTSGAAAPSSRRTLNVMKAVYSWTTGPLNSTSRGATGRQGAPSRSQPEPA